MLRPTGELLRSVLLYLWSRAYAERNYSYGRAEGAGALYLKRLSDAIQDGDPVRAVIRSTAVNT